MKFKKLRFKNFLSYGNTFTEFDLDCNKSILITGENGSGKTAFMEALYFAISGKAFRDINKPKLINSTNKKECLVEVEFEHNNSEYLLRRGIKPDVFELFKNNELIDKDAATKDYQKILENILGIDANTFGNSVFVSSKNYKPFMKLSAAEKRAFIENVLNIKVFSEILEQTKIKRTLHNEKHNSIEFNLKNTTDKLNIAKESNEKYAKSNDEEINNINTQIETEKANLSPIDDELKRIDDYLTKNKFDHQIEAFKEKVEALNNESKDHIEKINKKFSLKLKSLQDEKDSINTAIQEVNGKKNTLDISVITYKKEMESYNKLQLQEKDNIEKECKQAIKDLNTEFNFIKTNNEKAISENNKRIAFYEHTSVCPTCQQSISPDSEIISNAINELKEKNDSLETEIDSKHKQLESEIKQINELHDNKLADLKAKYQELIKKTESTCLDILNNIKELDEKIKKYQEDGTLIKEKISTIEDEKQSEVKTSQNEFEVKIEETKSEIVKLESALKKATDRQQTLNTNKKIIETKINSFNERIKELSSIEKKDLINTKVFEDALIEIRKEKEDSEYHKETIEMMIKMLGDKGLKSYIVKKYIPTINELTNKYLEIFSANYRVSFDENFDMKIHNKGYDALDYGSFSSGETQRLDISLIYSFFELGQRKNTIRSNCYFMDEVADISLDEAGLNGLVSIFNNMKKEGKTIFSISHRSEIQNMFDQVLFVTKERFSKIKCID